MNRTAIVAAFPGEITPLVKSTSGPLRHERHDGIYLWRRRSAGREWAAACAGAGQQTATRALAAIEKDGPVSRIVSIGWAGALTPDFLPGRAYVVSEIIDSQTGERFSANSVEPEESKLGSPECEKKTSGTSLVSGHDFTACGKTHHALQEVSGHDLSRAVEHSEDHGALAPEAIRLVTTPRVANADEKRRLVSAYSASLVDMEAAAIARLAQMRGIPFYCIKGVSDGVADHLPDFNRFLSPSGQLLLARLTLFATFRPWRWPSLIRMGENSHKASLSIAESLRSLLEN
jgi:nucleoside phosphorylase